MGYNYTKRKKIRIGNLPVTKLILRLLLVITLFSASRWLIYLFNSEFFHHLTLGQALRLYFVGMRFDLTVIAYANIPIILYYCLPLKVIYNKLLHRIVNFYYIIVNSILVILNMIDVIYFRFNGKRMTMEILDVFGNPSEKIWPIVGQAAADYWYLLVLMVLFVMMLVVGNARTELKEDTSYTSNNRWYFMQWLSLMVFALLTPLACRGGLQAKPINMETASQYADSQNIPIVLNTPFVLMTASTDHSLKEVHYYEPEDMEFSPIHDGLKPNRFIADSMDFQPNLMILVLESFGQEMITYYNPDRRYPLTPFLDSLLTNSLTFNGRANGRRSIEVLPSLFSGIPSLMDVDYTSSPYFDNKVDGVGNHLKALGYHTAMFYGGKNETVKYEKFARNVGFDAYFGLNEYDKLDAYMSDLEQPFAICIHTLSLSHPTQSKQMELPKESYLWSGFEKTVYDTDSALRDFFAEAEKQPWFDSTLFVITANNANSEHYLPEYSNVWGMYSIPMAFYMPSQIEPLRSEELVQQVDLNVSVLSALGVYDPVFSFGRNVFDSLSEPSSIAYINQTYQYSNGMYLVQSDGENTIGVFNIQRDRQLNDNLIDHIQCPDLAKKMKELIQEYINRLIFNQLYINEEDFHGQAEDTIHYQSNLWEDAQEEPTQPD